MDGLVALLWLLPGVLALLSPIVFHARSEAPTFEPPRENFICATDGSYKHSLAVDENIRMFIM